MGQGPDQEAIYSRFNCVLRHHVCPNGLGYHTPGIGTEEEYRKCLMNIVDWEGVESVRAWLIEMAVIFPHTGKEALTRFEGTIPEIYGVKTIC